jgi:AmmeMemoRadiSam system protein B
MRRRVLPEGWYPSSRSEIEGLVAQWMADPPPRGAVAAVAPHAGWAFSGRLAAKAALSLAEAETIAVIGGHLPAGYPVLLAEEEAFETPLGALYADLELAGALREAAAAASIRIESDRAADNTVEIQLPILRALYPAARVLWLRAPASEDSIRLGEALAGAAASLGRSFVCLGSTDLTHYGPDYDFEPEGRGPEAEAWARDRSDKSFIDALLDMDAPRALARGEAGAACSSGAAAAALSFAAARGAAKPRLLAYAQSLELRRASSFVGYCALGFYR